MLFTPQSITTYKMASQSTIPETQESSSTTNSSNSYPFRCAAGIYCKLPPQTKTKLQEKMTQLAEDFIQDNF